MMDNPQPTDPKEHRITVRITEAELSALQLEASKRGTTLGDALRQLIREQLAKG